MIEAMKHIAQATVEVIKTAPVAAILYWNAFIAAVPTITMLLALTYLILQISYLLWKWRKEKQDAKSDT